MNITLSNNGKTVFKIMYFIILSVTRHRTDEKSIKKAVEVSAIFNDKV